MKKRFLLMMLAGVLAFSMIGCGGGQTESEDPNTNDEIVENEEQDVEQDAEKEEEPEVQEPEVQEPEQKPEEKPEQKPEVQEPVVDEPEVEEPEVEEENTGDAEGGIVIDKAFAEMTLEEMIMASYADMELPFTDTMEFDKNDAETLAYHLGTSDVTFKRGVISQAMMSSIAHSVVVLELEDGADAAAVAATLEECAPVDKWICVVPDQVGSAHRGNIVMVAMSGAADAILENFTNLK